MIPKTQESPLPMPMADKYAPAPAWRCLCGYFLLLLVAAMPHFLHTELVAGLCFPPAMMPPCAHDSLTPFSTLADIVRVFRTADAAFIAERARTIVDTGDWGHVSLWPLWPPGMVVIETALYALSREMPVALVLVVFTCALWAGVLTQAARALERALGNRFVALFLPLLLTFSKEFHYFLHEGLFYTESYSLGFFLSGVGFLLDSIARGGRGRAIVAGMMCACSAYMRAQTDLVMNVTLALLLLAWLGKAYSRYGSFRSDALKQTFQTSGLVASLAVMLLSYHALTLPYRAAHQMQWIGFSQSPIWHAVWQREEELPPVLNFYVTGGALAGCAVDPDLCERIHARIHAQGEGVYDIHDYLHFTLATAFSHPARWLAFKLPYLLDFWAEPMPEAMCVSLFMLFMLARYTRSKCERRQAMALLLVAAGIGIMGPLLLIHIEPRYLYQLRLLGLYALILAPAMAERAVHEAK